jgi:hypothetical protein
MGPIFLGSLNEFRESVFVGRKNEGSLTDRSFRTSLFDNEPLNGGTM